MGSNVQGSLRRDHSVPACPMGITQSQSRIPTAAKALKNCNQLPSHKAVGDAARDENKTFPNISLHLLHNREHHVTITPKSSLLRCASNYTELNVPKCSL